MNTMRTYIDRQSRYTQTSMYTYTQRHIRNTWTQSYKEVDSCIHTETSSNSHTKATSEFKLPSVLQVNVCWVAWTRQLVWDTGVLSLTPRIVSWCLWCFWEFCTFQELLRQC